MKSGRHAALEVSLVAMATVLACSPRGRIGASGHSPTPAASAPSSAAPLVPTPGVDAGLQSPQRAAFTWTVASIPDVAANSLAATSEGVVWAISTDVLLRSTDHGHSFTPLRPDLRKFLRGPIHESGGDLRRIWARGSTVYLATSYKLFAGTNLGTDFVELAAPTMDIGDRVVPSPIEAIAGTQSVLVYATNPGELYQSNDDGRSFTKNPAVHALYQGAFLQLSCDAEGRTYVLDGFGRLLVSTDFNATWSERTLGVEGQAFAAFAAGPSGHALAAVRSTTDRPDPQRLARTTDTGKTWQTIVGDDLPLLWAAGAAGDWTGLSGDQIVRTSDDGLHWTKESVRTSDASPDAQEALTSREFKWTAVWRSDTEGYAMGSVLIAPRVPGPPREVTVIAHGQRPSREK